jgi:hypothetical protein
MTITTVIFGNPAILRSHGTRGFPSPDLSGFGFIDENSTNVRLQKNRAYFELHLSSSEKYEIY